VAAAEETSRAEVLQEAISAAITAVSLIVVVLAETRHADSTPLIVMDTLACAYFWVEFFVGLARAREKPQYLRAQVVPMLGAVPVLFHLRWLRVVRLLRLLRFLRMGVALLRLWRLWGSALVKEPAQALGFAALSVMVLGSAGLYAVEHPTNPSIKTFWDAIWLCATSLTTVGFGDVYPTTAEGRIISFIIMLLGIGIIGSLTATIAAYILRESGLDDITHSGLVARMSKLERKLNEKEEGGD